MAATEPHPPIFRPKLRNDGRRPGTSDCADGIGQLTAMLGNPRYCTFGQRLLLAARPAPAARLRRPADLASGVRRGRQ